MKKIRLIAVGKVKESYYREAIAEYGKRIGRFADFEIIETPESPNEDTDAEAAAIVKACRGYCILFDIDGKEVTSPALAETLDRAYLNHDAVAFIIGSSRGVAQAVRDRADLRISFGRVTFPHTLFRVMAAEQIYRALCISEGVKYHK